MNKYKKLMANVLMLMLLVPAVDMANASTDNFSAVLEHQRAKPQNMDLGDIKWSCTGTRCRGRGHTGDAVAACLDLARHMGPVKSFIAKGRILQACHPIIVEPVAGATKGAPAARVK